MINIVETQTTPTIAVRSALALAFAGAIMGSPSQYRKPAEAYEVNQVSGSYSAFDRMQQTSSPASEAFAKSMATIYLSLAERQEPFGKEFEAAIFDNIEELYEA